MNFCAPQRERAGFPEVQGHDFKHTFGRRLRAAGVSFEDRKDQLGHKSGRITTYYSAAELHNLIDAANRVLDEKSRADDFEQENWLEKVALTN
jgi:integrase